MSVTPIISRDRRYELIGQTTPFAAGAGEYIINKIKSGEKPPYDQCLAFTAMAIRHALLKMEPHEIVDMLAFEMAETTMNTLESTIEEMLARWQNKSVGDASQN